MIILFLQPDAVSPQCLKHLVERCGSKLQQLNVSGNQLRSFNAILTALAVSREIPPVYIVILIIVLLFIGITITICYII